jgi:cell division septum initiation protein DivIVA
MIIERVKRENEELRAENEKLRAELEEIRRQQEELARKIALLVERDRHGRRSYDSRSTFSTSASCWAAHAIARRGARRAR